MYKFICLALLVAAVTADKVNFKDCAHKEIKNLKISNCSGDFCVIHKGKDLKLDADFVANQDSKKVEIKIIAKVNGMEIQVPGIDTDGCRHVKCPLVKGQQYTFSYDLVVPKILPNVKAEVTAKLVGDHGDLACGSVNGEVKE